MVAVVFGVDDATIATFRAAVDGTVALARHSRDDVDPELGANLMVFFCRDWAELHDVPNLDRLVPGLDPLVTRLERAGSNQYRVFRFDPAGAIKAAVVFVRMDDQMGAVPADTLALSQVAQTMLLWSDTAFRDRSPLAVDGQGRTGLRSEIGALLRVAYDPVLPPAAADPSHALRLAARIARMERVQ